MIVLTGYQMDEVDEIIERKRVHGELLQVVDCPHRNVVKEYYLGTHSDYACLDCGMKSLEKSHFRS